MMWIPLQSWPYAKLFFLCLEALCLGVLGGSRGLGFGEPDGLWALKVKSFSSSQAVVFAGRGGGGRVSSRQGEEVSGHSKGAGVPCLSIDIAGLDVAAEKNEAVALLRIA